MPQSDRPGMTYEPDYAAPLPTPQAPQVHPKQVDLQQQDEEMLNQMGVGRGQGLGTVNPLKKNP